MSAKFFYRSVDLINSVSKKIVVNNLIKKQDRILLSFSGGQDSICLLFLLNQLYSQMELNLALFWCNHLWQKESFSLMEQIAKLSFLFQFNSCFAIPSSFILSELSARKWRHKSSYRVSSFYNYSKICLAHTSNDKIETLFLNLMRGSGLSGLSPLRWTQFFSKNFIEREEHTSQIFSSKIFPFFWFFASPTHINFFTNKRFVVQNEVLKDSCKKKNHICFSNREENLGANSKKINTFFLFSWKSNVVQTYALQTGTTNLTNISVLFTIYSRYFDVYYPCTTLAKQSFATTFLFAKVCAGVLSGQNSKKKNQILKILSILLESPHYLINQNASLFVLTFQPINQVPVFTNFNWKAFTARYYVENPVHPSKTSFLKPCKGAGDKLVANNPSTGSINSINFFRDKQSIVAFFDRSIGTDDCDTWLSLLGTTNSEECQSLKLNNVNFFYKAKILKIQYLLFSFSFTLTDFMSKIVVSQNGNDLLSVMQTVGLQRNNQSNVESRDKLIFNQSTWLIPTLLVIKSDFFSLNYFQFFSSWMLKKIIFKKHIKKFSTNSLSPVRGQSCFVQKETLHFAMCNNKKKRNVKNKKNIKAKKWFKCVSYTFFKSCSTYL